MLSDISVRRPVLATMLTMAIVVFGLVSLTRLGIDRFPEVDFPIVAVTTTLEGADAEVMDIEVTDVIEEAVNTIEGIKHITSQSLEGYSQVTITFELGRDIDDAAQDVRDKVATVRNDLPEDVDPPVIDKLDLDSRPFLWIALIGNKPLQEITHYAKDILKPRLERIQGVGSIWLSGGREREIRVWLNANRLEDYHLTAADVSHALKTQHIEIPGGRIETGVKEFTVKTKGEFPTVPSFGELIIAYRNGSPVKLRDVGFLEDGMEDKRGITWYNEKTAVGLGIRRRSGANTVAVARKVKAELEKARATLPPGLELHRSSDSSLFIEESIAEIRFHLIIGAILAALVVYLFLHNWRSTIVTGIAIPTSIIGTFTLMRLLDFTLNNMTMLALTIAVGIVIDDAIVVLESIYRHRQQGEKLLQAAVEGTREVAFAVIASTLSIAAIFTPVAFMSGLMGRFFYEFGFTVAAAVLISLFISLTLTPMLCSRFLKTSKEAGIVKRLFDSFFAGLNRRYRWLLAAALRHRLLVVLVAVGSFVFSLYLGSILGKELTPTEDQAMFWIRSETDISTSVEYNEALMVEAARIVSGRPEIRSNFAATGLLRGEVNKGIMFVNLTDKKEREVTQDDIMKDFRQKLNAIPGFKSYIERVAMLGSARRTTPIEVDIQGPDLQKLDEMAQKVIRRMAKIPGIVDINTDLEIRKPEVRLNIDREKAGALGVDIRAIADTVRTLIGGRDVAKFKSEGDRHDIRVRLIPTHRDKPGDISHILVRASDSKLVKLSNVVNIQEGVGPAFINRKDRQRSVTIFADLEGIPLGGVVERVNRIIAEEVPPGYYYSWSRHTQDIC